ncbi:uncharacterized serine/threonine-protein kinase SBK3 [Osmerus eperlanus]|uniref:uncharacterized serine/threonine-protein kinase SBK3 n=1 Tax=Osmerus eperlanus TaxID=29151 RepID=UPI002E0D6033
MTKQAAAQELDELCFLSAQAMCTLETSDHFTMVKLLGEASYGKVMLAVHKKRGTPMALKFFQRRSTSLFSFLREYNLSLSFCTHPSLTRALGIFFSTPLRLRLRSAGRSLWRPLQRHRVRGEWGVVAGGLAVVCVRAVASRGERRLGLVSWHLHRHVLLIHDVLLKLLSVSKNMQTDKDWNLPLTPPPSTHTHTHTLPPDYPVSVPVSDVLGSGEDANPLPAIYHGLRGKYVL